MYFMLNIYGNLLIYYIILCKSMSIVPMAILLLTAIQLWLNKLCCKYNTIFEFVCSLILWRKLISCNWLGANFNGTVGALVILPWSELRSLM